MPKLTIYAHQIYPEVGIDLCPILNGPNKVIETQIPGSDLVANPIEGNPDIFAAGNYACFECDQFCAKAIITVSKNHVFKYGGFVPGETVVQVGSRAEATVKKNPPVEDITFETEFSKIRKELESDRAEKCDTDIDPAATKDSTDDTER